MSGYYNTFIVRLWCDECDKLVRGQIEHTGTQEHAYFDKLEDMNKFMLKRRPSPNGLNGQDKE